MVLRVTGTAIAASALALAFAGEAPADGAYEEFRRGVYLSYVNAPGADEDMTRIPLLRATFGGAAFNIVMDTGSTGIVVSAHRIPNIDALPSLGPGRLTYTSSGRIMIGRRVLTAMTVMGANGAQITTSPISVLAVTRIECTARARNCRPNDDPRGVSMMGIGFGRGHGAEAEGDTRKNPFTSVATVAAPSGERESAQDMRRGYIVTRRGVHVGLTAENTQVPFDFVALTRSESGNDWSGIPACIAVNGAIPAACGHMLMDTGVTTMYLTLPDSQVAAAVRREVCARLHARARHRPDDLVAIRRSAANALHVHGRPGGQPAGAAAPRPRPARSAALRQYQPAAAQRLRLSVRCRRRPRRLPTDQPRSSGSHALRSAAWLKASPLMRARAKPGPDACCRPQTVPV